MKIRISNTTQFDKNIDEFINNPIFKYAGGSSMSHNDTIYLKILSNAVPEKIDQIPFKDLALSKEETTVIQKVFVDEILKLLLFRTPIKKGTNKLEFLGSIYIIDQRPTSLNYQDCAIMNYHRIYEISEECLQENKPMYMSIYEDQD